MKEKIKKLVEEKGGKIDENMLYVNNTTNFNIYCSKNHKFKTTWGILSSGCWCKKCSFNYTDKNLNSIKEILRKNKAKYEIPEGMEKVKVKSKIVINIVIT